MIRPYETKDKTDCLRILKEVGWLEGKDKDGAIFDAYGSDSKAFVAELEGAAEVFAITRGGDCKYQEQDLPFSRCDWSYYKQSGKATGSCIKSNCTGNF